MSELSKKDSDSDVDSNSSWTLLAGDANGDDDRSTEKNDKQAQENVKTNPEKSENTLEIKENELATEDAEKKLHENETHRENDIESLSSNSSTCSLDSLLEVKEQEGEVKEQGCPTFDEYMNEKERAHDCDYDDRAEFWEHLWNDDKKNKRKYKKCKAQNLTTMTVVGAVLSIAGVSLICMISPFFGKQIAPSDIHNRIEKNFTRIETPYAKANDLKVYVDRSKKATTLIDNIDVLDPIIQKCCSSHATSNGCAKTCPKNVKPTSKSAAINKPITHEQFLKQQLSKKENVDVSLKETAKAKPTKNDKCIKVNENKKLNIKQSKNLKMEQKAEQKEEDLTEKNRKEINDRNLKKKNRDMKTLDEALSYVKKRINSKLDRPASRRHEYEQKDVAMNGRKVVLGENKKSLRLANNFKDMFKNMHSASEPNFVLVKDVNSHKETNNINAKKGKVTPLVNEPPKVDKRNFILPDKVTGSKGTINIENVLPKWTSKVKDTKIQQADHVSPTCAKNTEPVSPNQTSGSNSFRTDFIACQLLQDLCMLKLTGKLNSKETYKQKKLKRKLDRKKLRTAKVIAEDNERGSEKKQEKKIPGNKNDTEVGRCKPLVTRKSVLNFKPKLVDNHFVTEFKPVKPNNISLSNFDLLKELPFMQNIKTDKSQGILICRPRPQLQERPFGQKIEYRTASNLIPSKEMQRSNLLRGPQNDIHLLRQQRFMICNEIANQKSLRYLEETRQKNEERLRILEQMRQENRMKIQALVRERTERLKKDAALGIYNIPLPNYKEVSEKLKQLRKKRTQSGFVFESVSSSDSEPEKNCTRSVESKISSELLTALKMGKKVSDTFREWTLKKAPTLTCLKNYCNSKVSQISERLTSQSMNQTNIKSTLNKEELEALKCRREKHEQLKKFWKAKQEYLDKRIEICELLKKKLSVEELQEKPEHNITQGVQILDSIISDVLKSVRTSKSNVDRTCHVEENVKETSKSVGNIVVKDEQNEKPAIKARKEAHSANSDELYNWLFERKAMEIRKRDRCLWNTAKPGYAERKKEVSKQDPSKGYHEKILKKHN